MPVPRSLLRHPPIARLGAIVALVTLVLDQVLKWWVFEVLDLQRLVRIEVTSFFNLTLVWNRGITFGLFNEGGPEQQLVLGAVVLAIGALLVAWLLRADTRRAGLGLGLVLGGAVGNLIDRWRFHAVMDFLDFHAFGWHYWVFNLADAAIVCGVGLLMLDALFQPQTSSK